MASAAPPSPSPRVAVIGGGIAGMSAARALVGSGVHATVLDLGERVGGRVADRTQALDGGRLLSFDRGAQFLTVSSPDFKAQLAEWQAAGVAQEWRARHGMLTAGGTFVPAAAAAGTSGAGFCGSLSGQPLYVGVPTNQALVQHMADSLAAQAAAQQQEQQQADPQADPQQQAPAFELLSGCAVQSAERVGGGCGCGPGGARWRLRGSRRGRAAAADPAAAGQQEDLGSYDAVVLADGMPLLPGSAGHVAGLEAVSTSLAQLARSVQAVAPEPCFALMLSFDAPLEGLPFDAAVAQGIGSSSGPGSGGGGAGAASPAFQWVACDSSKPGRPAGAGAPQCWVALTTPDRAARLLQAHPLTRADGRFNPQTREYRQAVAAELLADFEALMRPFLPGGTLPRPAYTHAQRWGRAFVTEPLGAEFLFLPAQRLALCGDVATGSGVEAAWRGGRAAGAAVASMLRSEAAN
ncbi:FAD NAD(P)-binding oxidoreductase family isoform 1 [Micractinium conductrix]|uniref:FAD NAD(P)-binding oxidoreductase family isoform 1 n=1 Tax=Micractinium conductrix TaxID=554055 RepID=A0A2P6VGB8_9CHLO|nr:FAD NAD(P)-binding oxidoreductase family isoform 1 [Micractinium conductrix]|eukprot:PSC73118.1 FAD NAD(P)-binding oxidoreductase family isoform 1 [Micractinium conductrix]